MEVKPDDSGGGACASLPAKSILENNPGVQLSVRMRGCGSANGSRRFNIKVGST